VRYRRVGPNATAGKDDVLLAREAAIDSWVQKKRATATADYSKEGECTKQRPC